MLSSVEQALKTLIIQYPDLAFSKTVQGIKGISEPVFEMPVPVAPHKRGDIIASAHNVIHSNEPYHRHNYFIILYAYRGDYEQVIESEQKLIPEGTVLILQPYVAHSLLAHQNPDDKLLTIRLRKELIFHSLMPLMPKDEEFLSFFLSPFNKKPTDRHKYLTLAGDENLQETLRSVFNILITEYVEMLPSYDTLLESTIIMLCSLLARCDIMSRKQSVSSKQKPLIDNILKYMNTTCATTSLPDVAEHFNYNPNYISTLLKKETQKTFSTLIREFRLNRACMLLRNSSLPVEEIAVLVGYPHTSNFYKTFRTEYHMTPHQYQDQFSQEIIA